MDALASLPRDPRDWAGAVASLDGARKADVAWWLVREWAEGRLEPRFLTDPTDAEALTRLRRELAAAVTALGGLHLPAHEWWGDDGVDAEMAARWCWIESWILLAQDEDLLLMRDELVATLLEQFRLGCPKRRWVLAIVLHHVRDQAHAQLRAGPQEVRKRLVELLRFVPPAKAAGAEELVAYLARLESYVAPRRVSRDEAAARVADLWRCHVPATVIVEAAGDEWRVRDHMPAPYEQWIVIDAKTGAMRLDAPWLDRAKEKGRHGAT
jgi:hypothetical protein